jgi:peptide deformylase
VGVPAIDRRVKIEHGSFRASEGSGLLRPRRIRKPGRPCTRPGRAPSVRRLVKRGCFAYFAAMSVRQILIHPEPRLRKVAAPVASVDDDIRALADDMLMTMYDAPGIGLAATQIGVMKRVFVMDCAGKDEPPQPMVLLNPEITAISEETVLSEEGCLSIPDVYEDVLRPARVSLRWLGLDGAPHEQTFADRWAVCAQHELDHLNGRLFIDHLSAVKRTMITARMRKLKRERARA